jgi:NAD(P)-dependent dehydrogenase (short-subunit alcohol dehydrogenase family)
MSDSLFHLRGKRALVTGGAHGLGRMIVEGLLRAGAQVAFSARKPGVAEAAARELAVLGQCFGLTADLARPEGPITLVEQYRNVFDGVDILVNNAGRSWSAPIETFPDFAWANVLTLNLQAPFKLVQLLIPELTASARADDPARVINIGSVAGVRIEPIQSYSYSASKAAVHQLTRQLAADLAARHISVNAVLPGYFTTALTSHLQEQGTLKAELVERIPLRRGGVPDDISGTVVFLCSRAGAYITGAEIPVDGGLMGCR